MRIWIASIGVAAALGLCACEEEPKIPEGFERLGGERNTHFVYVDPKFLGDKLRQRQAGKAICAIHGHADYCEVYMWSRRADVAERLPVDSGAQPFGLYELKDGKVKLKSLTKE